MRLFLPSIFFLLLSQSIALYSESDQKKLIVVLSTPRSLSTAFLRMMEARGDCVIYSEPGADAHAHKYTPELIDTCEADSPKTFAEAGELIRSLYNQHDLVCIKEMGYAADEYLFKGDLAEFILQEAHVVFLMRNPHFSMLSCYTLFPVVFDLLPQWFDYERLYWMYNYVRNNARHAPSIMMVNSLVSDSAIAITAWCTAVDLPFKQECLTWKLLSDDTIPSDHMWNNDVCKFWYGRAMNSTCFAKQTEYACDDQGEPTFEEITNPEHRALYKEIYKKNLPYYHLFAQEAERLASVYS